MLDSDTPVFREIRRMASRLLLLLGCSVIGYSFRLAAIELFL
jgi:hypothetical protein